MWEKIANYKWIVVSLILGISAMVIIILVEKYLAVSAFKTAIIDISSAVLAIAVIGLAFDLFLRKEMINLIIERVHLSGAVSQAGLEDIRIGRDYLEVKKLVNESQQSICILGITSHAPIIGCRNEIRDALGKREVVVKILICQEESFGVKAREDEKNAAVLQSGEILDSKNILKDITNEIEISSNYNRKKYGKLEIRQYERVPLCSLYISDWKKCLYIPYLFKIRGANCPVFRFYDVKNGGIFTLLKTHFQKLWDDANENIAFSWPSQSENTSRS